MSGAQSGGSLKGFYAVFGVVALIGVGALGFSVGSKMLGTPAMEPVDLGAAREDLRLLRDLAVPVVVGNDDAPATIIVFGDFYCTHCAAFSLRERPRVESELIETGKARLEFYDFVLDPRPEAGTFLAARAARCAGDQGRYWDYHDHLYRRQLSWGMEIDKLGAFLDYGEELGLDRGEFRGCLNSDRHAREVSANLELARALGLGGTPSILVGVQDGMSRRVPDYFFESINMAVEELLSGMRGD